MYNDLSERVTQQSSLSSLPSARPNASRIVISWPKGAQFSVGNFSSPEQSAAKTTSTTTTTTTTTTTVSPTTKTSACKAIAQTTTKTTTSRRPTTRRPASSPVPIISSLLAQDWLSNQVHTTPRPYDEKRDCGLRPMRREGRVVGGRDSQLGEFPWSVLIRETTLLGFFIKTKCGGVLIGLRWVLTAAHCQPGMFGSLLVVLGEHDLSRGSKSYFQQQGASSTSGSSSATTTTTTTGNFQGRLKPMTRRVKRMIIHRDYNPANFDNDIALLELESPFQMQPHVVPICLPEKDEDFIGQMGEVAGWGKLSFGGPVPKVLQAARLPVIGNKQCQEMYRNSGHLKLISDSFICAGYENGGRDSCEGDSGGPLQVQRRNESRWVLAGTVSHGVKCAEPEKPGVYIAVSRYVDWIHSVIHHQDKNKRYGPQAAAAAAAAALAD